MEMETSEGYCSYYGILGVNSGCSDEEIRRAYKKLAMQWHPDKWTRSPAQLSEAKHKFQQIQEAYSVLSDRRKRAMYDAGVYDPEEDEDEVEGFADFLQEMVSLVQDVKKEGNNYSMEDLQSMLWEMAQDFETPDWCKVLQDPLREHPEWLCGQGIFDGSAASFKDSSLLQSNTDWQFSSFGMYGTSHFCR